jgi:hypothetical protein
MSRFITYTNTLALFGLNVMLCYEQSKSTKHWDNCLSHCIQADALSRRPDHTKGEEDDELVTMLPKEQFISLIATDLRDQIQTLSSNDDFIKGIIKCLKEQSTPPLRTALSDWTLDDGIILFKNKVFVPNNKDIR